MSNKWYAFIGIALLSFGCYLDYTVVNIALPAIQQDIEATLVSMQWVMNIYFLALCVSATVMGRLGDRYGRALVLYVGGAIFLIASIIAGCSFNIHWLIGARLLQGLGAASIFPLGLSLLSQVFPEEERAKAVTWFGSIGGIALALGPLLGGLIVTYWGWRWIFFINIPICILGYLFCFKSVKEPKREIENSSLDSKGMFFLALTLCSLTLGLIYSQTNGWNGITLLCFVVAVFSSIVLVNAEKDHPNPLIDFNDYGKPLLVAGILLSFMAGVLSAVTLFFDPIYLQIIKKMSAKSSGFAMFAIPLSVFTTTFFVAELLRFFGLLHTILLGLTIGCLSLLMQIFFTIDTTLFYILVSFISLGCMWAMGNTLPIIAVQTAVGMKRSSAATGTLVTLFNIGGSIGLTLAVVIYHFFTNQFLSSNAVTHVLNAADFSLLKDCIANPAQSLKNSAIHNVIHPLFTSIFMRGFNYIMLFLLLCTSMALLVAWRCKVVDKKVGNTIQMNEI